MPEHINILALDIATCTGFAYGSPRHGERATSGSIRFQRTHTMARFEMWLDRLMENEGITHVVFERPMDPRRMPRVTNFDTTRRLIGMCGCAEARAGVNGAECSEVDVGKVRYALLARRPQKGKGKTMVADLVKVLGYRPKDDNESDALAIWLYACGVFAPGAIRSTPLDLGGPF